MSTEHQTQSKASLTENGYRYQWQLFLVALAFFTRIPIPINTPFSTERLNHANRYFGVIGLIVGVICSLIYLIFILLFPPTIAIGIAMISGILITGAFHEDGLADVFDGFGGGWTIESKLNIMKDSRLGTYGASALVMALGLKWVTLVSLANISLYFPVYAFIVIHCISRVAAASLIFSYPYVRADQDSKVKPLANQQSLFDIGILLTTAVLILTILPLSLVLGCLVTTTLVRQSCGYWFNQQLGGYTGDCLGATQQLAEIAGYLTLLAFATHYHF
ncbi:MULTISPECIES: adenosylcobinamide-GDP ribazoletransferase [unclassified Photobacterium]|uniref:adenosylcobinamide-GDP ribazoletransferase n=1 Tax=unclassified Photobacterium TaxID=2628852 RepID=UPI001EDF3BCA|nr:adenosylcobinamide-GDP ribazoletransferase [Photobacterium sp. Ph6]MCG3874617.1 adenosylcobinamide-GDP ribazoletransferase [Photobacterium sp. Ph5]